MHADNHIKMCHIDSLVPCMAKWTHCNILHFINRREFLHRIQCKIWNWKLISFVFIVTLCRIVKYCYSLFSTISIDMLFSHLCFTFTGFRGQIKLINKINIQVKKILKPFATFKFFNIDITYFYSWDILYQFFPVRRGG